jgi:hypothetical protein
VDVPRTSYGLKSDEATYVAAALSAAYDRDLAFDRHDLERFAGLYHSGPDGIFLKRGKQLRIRVRAPFPFVHLVKQEDPDETRLYFGKALAYPLFAAPLWLASAERPPLFSRGAARSGRGRGTRFWSAVAAGQRRCVQTASGASVPPAWRLPDARIFNFTLVPVRTPLALGKRRRAACRMGRWSDSVAAASLASRQPADPRGCRSRRW